MITERYNKKCNATILSKELKDAGFSIYGVSCNDKWVRVYLEDSETKDPKPIVDKHVYTPPKTPEEIKERLKIDYAGCQTDAERIDFMAKMKGLK